MNVGFLTKSADPSKGSARVRVTAYLDYLHRAGISTRILRAATASKIASRTLIARP